jgi:hypothetical protein
MPISLQQFIAAHRSAPALLTNAHNVMAITAMRQRQP